MVAPHNTGSLVRSLVRVPGSGSNRRATAVPLDLSNVSSLAAMVPVPQVLPRALHRSNHARAAAQRQEGGQSHINAMNTQKLVPSSIQVAFKGTSNNETETRQLKRPLSQDNEEERRNTTIPAPKMCRVDNQMATPVSNMPLQTPRANASQTTQQVQYFMLPLTSAVVVPGSQQVQMASLPVQVVLTRQNLPQANTLTTAPVVLPQNGMIQIINLQNARRVPVTGAQALQNQQNEVPRIAVPTPTQAHQTAYTPQMSSLVLQQELARLKKENESLNQNLNKYQNIFKNRESLQLLARRLAETQT